MAHVGADFIEPAVLDGAVRGVVGLANRGGERLRGLQSGFLRHYAVAVTAGLSVAVIYLLMRTW
jgi:hypothetical protein